MRIRRLLLMALWLALMILVSGCLSEEPLEQPVSLEGDGFSVTYHRYMWTRAGSSADQAADETTYIWRDSDAFFSVVRIDAGAAVGQGLETPEDMERLLRAYVSNYGGRREKIRVGDSDSEYIRWLEFEYDDFERNAKYKYIAKLVMDKETGGVMAVIAAYQKNSARFLKNEIEMIMDSALMVERA